MTYSGKYHRLSDLAEIQIGYTARGRLERVLQEGVPAVQLRDLQGEADCDLSALPLYPLDASYDRYWAGPGDVLFRSRGERNTATVVSPETKGMAVAILPLMVLRPNRALVEPGYLAWFINQAPAQTHFDKCARGTSLRMIPRGCLDNLEIALPDLATQRRIVELDALARHERLLAGAVADKRMQLMGSALLALAQKTQPINQETKRAAARRAVE